ncbi:hypothetical protein N9I31_06965 [Candidatus Pseudothioglobus singularis]|nr:hypothetical protein [Candidatus Pseudothioglobus singularis]
MAFIDLVWVDIFKDKKLGFIANPGNIDAVKNKLPASISLILLFLTLLFSFFPYITPFSFGTDIQPWSILMVTTYSMSLFYNGYRFQRIFIYLMIPMVFSISLFYVGDNQFSSIRSIAGYFNIVLTPFVFYFILNKYYDLTINFLKLVVITYLIIGLIQTVFDVNFLSLLLNRVSTFGGRGVTSLCPEPTFYGIVCLFLILLFLTLDIKNKNLFICLLVFQILFISKSTMVILLLLIFWFYYAIFKLNAKLFLLLFMFLIIAMVIFITLDSSYYETRVLHLFNKLITNPESLINDGSINSRLGDVYFPIMGFIDNFGMPHGFGSFSNYQATELLKQDIFLHKAMPNDRIMSFYGGILFELGVIGLLIPISYSIILLRAYKKNIKNFLVFFFFLNTILFTAVPASLPLVGIYIAALLYRSDNSANVKYE